jgi:signal transduction histidine kinase
LPASFPASHAPEGLGGRHAGGADGGQEPGDGADREGGGQPAGPGDGRDDDSPMFEMGVEGGRCRAEPDADDAAQEREEQGFGEELDADVAFGGAQRAAQPDFGALLERLLANLLDNAERYNIAGGTVEISTTAHDTTSVLRVVNTGEVVPADMVERLFLPFTRNDDRTRHDGFGLGLTLVSSIAAVHGGTVEATAMPTGGLDISVRLPRRVWER